MFADGSFCGDQLVDLLLRGRELLVAGLLVAGDDRRFAPVVAAIVKAEVGDRGEAGRAEPADQDVVTAGGDLRAARGSGGGGPQQPGPARWRVEWVIVPAAVAVGVAIRWSSGSAGLPR
ncbi:hypothetical protein ACPF8X_00805 [Streptomyces sp. G35A]